jgi:hypothetical protein
LLGLSSPAEREHIESDFFEDDDAFQAMLTAEDDLIDAYARGELAGEERRTFEQRFVSSFREKDRVQFARAFASTVSAKNKIPYKLPGTFMIVQSPRLLRTVTVAAMIVLVVGLAWLVIDHNRMTNELRALHAESVELGKRVEAFERSSDNEQTRSADTAAKLADRQAPPDRPRHREAATAATQRATNSGSGSTICGTTTDPNGNVVRGATVTLTDAARNFTRTQPTDENGLNVTSAAEAVINTSDANLGNSFENKRITELPLNANNVVGLLSLQPVSRTGYVNGGLIDQSNITLDGVDAAIRISSVLSWIRFQITLETAATHDEYRIIIKTVDGRPVTSVDWIEPVTPNRTIIDTPAIATVDLPSGDYVLVLMGKDADGSFVKVGDYFFKVIK